MERETLDKIQTEEGGTGEFQRREALPKFGLREGGTDKFGHRGGPSITKYPYLRVDWSRLIISVRPPTPSLM